MTAFFHSIFDFIKSTQVLEQINQVDAGGLFTNAYFLIPFICLVAYLFFRQSFANLFLLAIAIGIWMLSGTQYMQELTVDGQIQQGKILPLAFGAIVVLGVIVYLLFGRSD